VGKCAGRHGPLQTSYTETLKDSLGKTWVDTFRTLKFSLTEDTFSGRTTGGFSNPTTVDVGTKERSYSGSGYFAPVQNRPNLHLLTGALVEKITFNDTCDPILADGVVIAKDDGTEILRAKKEVILAAGTFNSSKLLELSGIGNPTILRPLGINVVIENDNIGEDLQDHPMTGISFEATDDVKTLDDLARQDPQAVKAAMESYQSSKSGPFSGSSINSFAFTAFCKNTSHGASGNFFFCATTRNRLINVIEYIATVDPLNSY